MIFALLGLALAQFPDAPVGKMPDVKEGTRFGQNVRSGQKILQQGVRQLVFSAPTSDTYLDWVKATVSFAQGERQTLSGYGPNDRPFVWRVLMRWPDNSVKLAQLKTLVFFGASPQLIELKPSTREKPSFSFHEQVKQAVESGAVYGIKVQTQDLDCQPLSGHWKVMVSDASELIIRYRSHCKLRSTGANSPVSMTSYVSVLADSPKVRLDVILGNDTLETPVQGGLSLQSVSLVAPNLPQFFEVNQASYGDHSVFLGDGQGALFRYVTTFDPAQPVTMLQTGSPLGFSIYEQAQSSGAFGFLQTTRVSQGAVLSAHAQVNNEAGFATAQENAYLGDILQNPGATGAQADFGINATLRVQKAMQAYSARMVSSILLASHRETYRPSYYWETRNGIEDRVSSVNYPDLFFWGGRIHFDRSWNNQYPTWHSRTSQAGFQPGGFSGWNAYDNQHMSLNTLRFMYMLTADPIIEDILRYNVSLANWNYYTDWLSHTEAERAVGRMQKVSIHLTELFPGMPESQLLIPRISQKFAFQKGGVDQHIQRFGIAAMNLFDACDPRVSQGKLDLWCPLQGQVGQNIVVPSWQTGFYMEAMALAKQGDLDLRYLSQAQDYFLQDGSPKTYFLITNPAEILTGGIGLSWWAGWALLAKKYPQAQGSQWVLTNFLPHLRVNTTPQSGQLWSQNDAWRVD